MTDREKVCTKAKKTIKQINEIGSSRAVVTLEMVISHLVISRNVQLSAMSSEIRDTDKSMKRWIKGDLDVKAVYMPFAVEFRYKFCKGT